eukprot:TRINITY_DN25759_c0_g1_i1.p1 TRINITY_DN25759_c0_g1~~TRINITY_DN25759_c0_g1_i1.p1  ORF type:complete len:354 (-),score=93.45 TRINITY_DN25759_c0_g1_i1:205-1266(-)
MGTNAALKKKFAQLDKDGSGALDLPELTELLQQGNKAMTDREVKRLFREVDRNGDGRVQFDEFVDYITALSRAPARHSQGAAAPMDVGDEGKWAEMEKIFSGYAGRDGHMDSNEWSKLCADCELFAKGKFVKADCDMIFTKSLGKGVRKFLFPEFKQAMMQVCSKLGEATSVVQDRVIRKGSGVAQAYTDALKDAKDQAALGRQSTRKETIKKHDDFEDFDTSPEREWDGVQKMFQEYSNRGHLGIEDFLKYLQDSRLCSKSNKAEDGKLSKTEAELIFANKHVAGRSKVIDFGQLQQAARLISMKLTQPIDKVQTMLMYVSGPEYTGTKAAKVRLHDDVGNYTGAAAARMAR